MAEHFQDPSPREAPRRRRASATRQNLEAALAAAKAHCYNIQHNPLAMKRQAAIITFWEEQIAAHDAAEWLQS